jgi:hypothetical protein
MPSTEPRLNVRRVVEIEDVAKATLDAILRENRMLSNALAAMGFGAGLAISGGLLLALDIWEVVHWPLAVLAVVSGATGTGTALTGLSAWQWRRGEQRLRKLEAKLHAVWFLQREATQAPVSVSMPAGSVPVAPSAVPSASPDAVLRDTFGRKHVTDAQEATEALLRRVMMRSKGEK